MPFCSLTEEQETGVEGIELLLTGIFVCSYSQITTVLKSMQGAGSSFRFQVERKKNVLAHQTVTTRGNGVTNFAQQQLSNGNREVTTGKTTSVIPALSTSLTHNKRINHRHQEIFVLFCCKQLLSLCYCGCGCSTCYQGPTISAKQKNRRVSTYCLTHQSFVIKVP